MMHTISQMSTVKTCEGFIQSRQTNPPSSTAFLLEVDLQCSSANFKQIIKYEMEKRNRY
jgi:hypothetical protein